MKELTKEQFLDRVQAVNRAMAIFGELTDQNMTRAFQAYQEVFAERERELFMIPSQRQIRKYEMLRCPECDRELLYRKLDKNPEGFKTQWVCSNSECDTVLNSEHDMDWWMNKLKIG